MRQIADRLEKLGMVEYAERFAENDIDMAVLPDLTDQHLKDLGTSLGHRLKMLGIQGHPASLLTIRSRGRTFSRQFQLRLVGR
jgi:hypothetical protein